MDFDTSENEKFREEFERWAKTLNMDLERSVSFSMYKYPKTRGAWAAWLHLAKRKQDD